MRKGLTLLEVMLTVGLIGILSFMLLRMMNPDLVLSQGRNAERQRELRLIADALDLYSTSNQGTIPGGIPLDTYGEICAQDASSCTGYIDLESDLVPKYLFQIPKDPEEPAGNGSGYEIRYQLVDQIPQISLGAMYSEGGKVIQINDEGYTPLP